MKKLVPFEDLRSYGITGCKVTLWRMEKQGKFPKRVRPTPGRYAWIEDEIVAFISKVVAERDRAANAQ